MEIPSEGSASSSAATSEQTELSSTRVGSSSVHNSVRRGLQADTDALAALRAEPPARTHVAALDAALPNETELMMRTEPTLVHGVTRGWRGTDPWDSESTLIKNFGAVRFDLAADLNMSVAEYVAYGAHTRADFPYYIYEREYVGRRGPARDRPRAHAAQM
jgi:hypothetical protein